MALLFGLGIGFAGGVSAGHLLFREETQSNEDPALKKLGLQADADDAVPGPESAKNGIVSGKDRSKLDFAPAWSKSPDYDKVMWFNNMLTTLWPYVNHAAGKEAMAQAQKPIADAIAPYPIIQAVSIENIDLGTIAPKIDGMKTFAATYDEAMLETVLTWASDLRIRVSVTLKVAGISVYVPLEVSSVQIHAPARITIAPLVETLPCVGGVRVSLLEVPYLDFSLTFVNALDLMQLPILKEGIKAIVAQVVGGMAVFPNQYAVDIMPGGGRPLPPAGLLAIKVLGVTDIKTGHLDFLNKVDPFVELAVRQGRTHRTETVYNNANPEYNQLFNFIVDNPEEDEIKILLRQQGSAQSKVIGAALLPVKDFLKPYEKTSASTVLRPPKANSRLLKFAKVGVGSVGAAGRALSKVGGMKGASGQDDEEPLNTEDAALLKGKEGDREEGDQEAVQRSQASTASLAPERGTSEDSSSTKDKVKRMFKGKSSSSSSSSKAIKGDKAEQERAKNKEVGMLRLEMQYFPFRKQGTDAPKNDKSKEAPDASAKPKEARKENLSRLRSRLSAVQDQKGILTVTLVKATNLAKPNSGQLDPFCELRLYDPATNDSQPQFSSTIPNEENPKWGEKFDYVMVSATSTLTVNVWDKLGFMEGRLTLKGLTGRKETKDLAGTLRLQVSEVVRNGRLRDSWALQETQKGDITLALEWTAVELAPPPGQETAAQINPALPSGTQKPKAEESSDVQDVAEEQEKEDADAGGKEAGEAPPPIKVADPTHPKPDVHEKAEAPATSKQSNPSSTGDHASSLIF